LSSLLLLRGGYPTNHENPLSLWERVPGGRVRGKTIEFSFFKEEELKHRGLTKKFLLTT